MDICVLGPLRAAVDEINIVPTAQKPRSLLALLAVYDDRVVPLEVIIAELWEEGPPPSVATTTQTYILHLRRLIRSALGRLPGNGRPRNPMQVLRTEPGGYALDKFGGLFDLAEHERLAARGYDAMQAGDFNGAKESFEAALALWRGAAFVDVVQGPRLSAQATLLEESRKVVLERRIQADLHLGRHYEILGELAGLTAEHPTDERLHAHYMVALYRAGRRAQALNVFERLQAILAEDLGMDPTPGLRHMHKCVLTADPVLESAVSCARLMRAWP